MVTIKEFVRESNAIEGVQDEDAHAETLAACSTLADRDELTHGALQATHRDIMPDRQPDIIGTTAITRCTSTTDSHSHPD